MKIHQPVARVVAAGAVTLGVSVFVLVHTMVALLLISQTAAAQGGKP